MSSPSELKKISSNSKEEKKLIIAERDHSTISFWWQTFQIVFYFAVFIGGICTSIALGNITTAFEPFCILNANLTITGVNDVPPVLDSQGEEIYQIYSKSVSLPNIANIEWGNPNGCLFSTFSPAAQAVFAFMWGALFLQCGKGGKNFENETQTWRIVAPALFFTIGLFIVSIVSLSMITSGLSSFCYNVIQNSAQYDTNITSCTDVFSLQFPWDASGTTNLYSNYLLAWTGSYVVFFGCLLALLLLILRCVMHVDFVIFERKTFPRRPEVNMMPSTSGSESQENQQLKRRFSPSASSSNDSDDEGVGVKNKSFDDEYNSKKSDKTTVPLLSKTDESFILKKVK